MTYDWLLIVSSSIPEHLIVRSMISLNGAEAASSASRDQ
jgi:hypothetical protein